jgi:hypothetical protein
MLGGLFSLFSSRVSPLYSRLDGAQLASIAAASAPLLQPETVPAAGLPTLADSSPLDLLEAAQASAEQDMERKALLLKEAEARCEEARAALRLKREATTAALASKIVRIQDDEEEEDLTEDAVRQGGLTATQDAKGEWARQQNGSVRLMAQGVCSCRPLNMQPVLLCCFIVACRLRACSVQAQLQQTYEEGSCT